MKNIIRFIIEEVANSNFGGFIALSLIFLSAAGIGLCGYLVGETIHWTTFPNLNYTIGRILGILTSGGGLLLFGWILGKISVSLVEDEEITLSKGPSKFWKTFTLGYLLLASLLIVIGIIIGLVFCLVYIVKWLFAK